MTHIIEFTEHGDKYLIHHFNFERNDSTMIGLFAGNCSLNKFMSLHDWYQIFDDLSEPMQKYIINPNVQPVAYKRKIDDTNFELNITWDELDATFYSKLLQSLDFNCVFPYVIKVNVSLRSNIDQFAAINVPVKTPIRRTTAADRKKAPKRESARLNGSQAVITNGVPHERSFEIKDCCVRLPMLQFDENGQVIQNGVRNKRKHSSIIDDETTSVRITSNQREVKNDIFMCSSSSTPFVRNINVALKQIEKDVRVTFVKSEKRTTNRLTTTPRSSQERKAGSQFNPRIRLLRMPDDMDTSKSSKAKNTTGKKASKANAKVKKVSSKKLKPKARSVTNESELFETPAKIKKVKKAKTAKKAKCITMPGPIPIDNVKLEECDLNSLTEDELWQSYDEHYDVISNLFLSYLKQTDATVQRAGDYNHFDVLSLLTTDQFSIMLDILFDKLVKIGEFGEINYDTLFLELICPEWTLAMFMQRLSLDRESAINRIMSQKSKHNQTHESYTTLLTNKLDDTENTTKMPRM